MSYQSWSERSTRGVVKLLLYSPIMFVMYYHANWIWLCTMLVEKCRKKPCEKRITKTQELRTNKWCHNELCIEILISYGIINLYNHMHFFRYLHVFTIHSCVSFPLIVLIHFTWIQCSLQNPFSNQWLYFLVTLYRIC